MLPELSCDTGAVYLVHFSIRRRLVRKSFIKYDVRECRFNKVVVDNIGEGTEFK